MLALSRAGRGAASSLRFRESTETRDGFPGLIFEFCSANLVVFLYYYVLFTCLSISEAIRALAEVRGAFRGTDCIKVKARVFTMAK